MLKIEKGEKMKVKTIAIAALLLTGITFTATAQTVVSEVVGFSKTTVDAGGLYIAGIQFNYETNTPQYVFGDSLPLGSQVFVFDGSKYVISTYRKVLVSGKLVTKWNLDFDLGSGQGFWVSVPSSTNVTFYGTVPTMASETNSLVVGLNLVSYPYPIDQVVTNLEFTPSLGDKIYFFNGVQYEIATYRKVLVSGKLELKWNIPDISIPVGQGFWYEAVSNQQWIATRPYEF